MMNQNSLSIPPHIRDALEAKRPIVALESTVISHGLPFPQNLELARAMEDEVRAAGAILAIGAWIQIGRTNAASPNAGVDLNLDSITAVVIGGTSLFGGRGTVWGTLLGALIVGVFRNGLSLAGLDVLWQTFAVGVLIVVAVSIDQWIRKVRK